MATPPASDEQIDGPDDGSEAAVPAAGPFNALTDDLSDLRIRHQHCWLWPHIRYELDTLDDILDYGHHLLGSLMTERPAWAMDAVTGIARANLAIHQYGERDGRYADFARRFARIPDVPPTLSDAQIYVVIAMFEARMAAETYCEIAAGIEEEMEQAGIGHDDEQDIAALRGEIAGWERELWRFADQYKATAERFDLMASFAVGLPDPAALQKAEAQLATMNRRLRKAEDFAGSFLRGRQRGAVSKLTRALRVLVERAGSQDFDAVKPLIEAACYEGPIEGIQFQDANDYKVWYLDVITGREGEIKVENLRRRLTRLPAI